MTKRPKTGVAAHYDAIANGYSAQYQHDDLRDLEVYPANHFRLQILQRELAHAELKSVYEVGVGEGTPLAMLAGMGLRVAGCDISERMVEVARGNFSQRGLDPALIQWGDIEDFTTLADQLEGSSFDALIAAGVLPHVRDDRLVLETIAEIVGAAGKVFVEFRNKLFSLFTFNRYTKEFILEDLLRDVDPEIRTAVASELDKRIDVNLPPVRSEVAGGEAPGYDAIPSKFHNPFELVALFERVGYRNVRIHWYHYHPAPPMLEQELGAGFWEAAMALEHEGSWRGYFLCSAGLIEADRA